MHEEAITRADHNYIVMEGASIDGARVLASQEPSVGEELTETRDRQAGFTTLPCWKPPW